MYACNVPLHVCNVHLKKILIVCCCWNGCGGTGNDLYRNNVMMNPENYWCFSPFYVLLLTLSLNTWCHGLEVASADDINEPKLDLPLCAGLLQGIAQQSWQSCVPYNCLSKSLPTSFRASRFHSRVQQLGRQRPREARWLIKWSSIYDPSWGGDVDAASARCCHRVIVLLGHAVGRFAAELRGLSRRGFCRPSRPHAKFSWAWNLRR